MNTAMQYWRMNGIKVSEINAMRKKVVACVDNNVGLRVLEYLLSDANSQIVFVITHPEKNALRYREVFNLCKKYHIPNVDIITAREEFERHFSDLPVDFLISIYFDYILDERFLSLPKLDAINLHPGYLPYNKGFYYYVWALLDGTPAGVSMHKMTKEVDGGYIISQKRVIIENTDTGESIYKKHEEESIKLFEGTWPNIVSGSYKTYPHLHGGTRKSLKAFNSLLDIDPYKRYRAIDLINQIRVTSHNETGGSRILIDGKEYSIKLQLEVTEKVRKAIPGSNRMI